MFERVTDMISGFGFEVEDEDFIRLCIESAQDYILDYCNLGDLPPNLISACTELACGKYLKTKLATGELEGADFESAVQAIKEGDVSISYNNGKSSREIFTELVEDMNDVSDRIIRYRKLTW